MKFCTAINCMDGRIQIPVINYLKKKFNSDVVDMITEAGPNRVLAEQSNQDLVNSIFARIKISVEKHDSKQIAVIGHFDCAGNPSDMEKQIEDTLKAVDFIRTKMKNVEVIGLWVDKNWDVIKI